MRPVWDWGFFLGSVLVGFVQGAAWRRKTEAAMMRWEQLRSPLLLHLNRSPVAGALSASVALELNRPLAAIQTTAEAAILHLKPDPPNTTPIEQLLGNIIRDDGRAAKIVSHLRGLLKKRDHAELQELDLNAVIRDTIEIFGSEALRTALK